MASDSVRPPSKFLPLGSNAEALEAAPSSALATQPFPDEDEDLVMASLDLDANGRVICLNRAARHVFGIALGRDVPVLLATFINPDHLSGFYSALADVERLRVPRSVMVTFQPPGEPSFRARLDIDVHFRTPRLCRVIIVALPKPFPVANA